MNDEEFDEEYYVIEYTISSNRKLKTSHIITWHEAVSEYNFYFNQFGKNKVKLLRCLIKVEELSIEREIKMTKTFLESLEPQIHVGQKPDGGLWWHINDEGNYWTGYAPNSVSPKELFNMCLSTLNDLMINHPGITLRDFDKDKTTS
jgi:hypothetical protein